MQVSDVLDLLHDSSADEDEVLYNLFDISDQMMQVGRFDLIDEILQQAQIEKITVLHLIGLLTVSMWCSTKLQHRSDFFNKVETHLIGIGRPNVEELLRGLR